MANTIALLRAVNVGGHNRVPMADLRKALERDGFQDVRTLLQSGNVVLQTSLAGKPLEAEVKKTVLQFADVEVITRSAGEWRQVIAENPFPQQAATDPDKLLVMFLKENAATNITANGPEKVAAAGKHLYIYYPAGAGQSKFTGSAIERALKTQGTARNWNTILKLNEML